MEGHIYAARDQLSLGARGQTAARATCEVTMNCASNLLLCFNNRGVLAAVRASACVRIFIAVLCACSHMLMPDGNLA
jgi:hypothetical protein